MTKDRPSQRAQERLADAVRREVAEARVRMDEAVLRADAHLHIGDREGARSALEDQRNVAETLRSRLEHALADAAVEREAEAVVSRAFREDRTGDRTGEAVSRRAIDSSPRGLGALVGALGAVLALALAVPSAPDPDTEVARTERRAGPVRPDPAAAPDSTVSPADWPLPIVSTPLPEVLPEPSPSATSEALPEAPDVAPTDPAEDEEPAPGMPQLPPVPEVSEPSLPTPDSPFDDAAPAPPDTEQSDEQPDATAPDTDQSDPEGITDTDADLGGLDLDGDV